jgi:Cu(I)/Ag(I) efflux system periplasmic protein CusF
MGHHISAHAAAALLALLLGSGTALAQHDNHHHGATAATATPATTSASAERPWAEAEIRRVDAAAGKISLKHGEIKNLDMPPMTMVFQLQDKALLGQLKAGDRVRFQADKINGSYTVLAIEPQP